MLTDFLQPVSDEIIQELKVFNKNCIGNSIIIHTEDNFPLFQNVHVAIIGIHDQRGLKKEENQNLIHIRRCFYQLFNGNWELNIIDLGDIKKGDTQNDTYYAVQQTSYILLQQGIKGIFFGGSQDMTFAIYSAYQLRNKLVNLVNIDSKFDLDAYEEALSANTFVAKMIMQEPIVLNEYTVLGYQSYYVSQESLDLFNAMFFNSIRLGDITNNAISVEPVLRYAHIVSVDMQAIESSYSGNLLNFSPNGLSGKEICIMMRYSGLGLEQDFLGIFNHNATINESPLISQMIWYYLDGLSMRYFESPLENLNNFIKYIVPIDDENFIFYKSKRTERWWMAFKKINNSHNKGDNMSLLACTESDYLSACNHEIPPIWLRNQKKI